MTDKLLPCPDSAGLVLFWGCIGSPGHYLWSRTGTIMKKDEFSALMVPSPMMLDKSYLYLPHPEKAGVGALSILRFSGRASRTILAWWGGPYDTRPGANSAIIVSGEEDWIGCWQRFSVAFPRLSSKLDQPTAWNARAKPRGGE